MIRSVAIFGLIFSFVFTRVNSHGRLRIPPQRSSLWREGLTSLTNHNDNELNCGGYWVQHRNYGGKCGVCGDVYGGTQYNQPPGQYAQGIIGRCYKPGTRWIDVKVEITANHLGYFQFKLCSNNDINRPVNQSCLDSNTLDIRDTEGRVYGDRYSLNASLYDIYLQVRLPDNTRCSQCVLQWIYTTGNNWGCFKGRCGLGIGSQETFINCADIAVSEDCKTVTKLPVTPSTTVPKLPVTPSTTAPKLPVTPSTTVPKLPVTPSTNTLSSSQPRHTGNCVAVGTWAKYDVITKWCGLNCPEYCPPDYCKCF